MVNVPAHVGLGEGLNIDVELDIGVPLISLLVGEPGAELGWAAHEHDSVVATRAVAVLDLAAVLAGVLAVDAVHH